MKCIGTTISLTVPQQRSVYQEQVRTCTCFLKHTERAGERQKGGDYISHIVDEQHLKEWTELH